MSLLEATLVPKLFMADSKHSTHINQMQKHII